MAICTGASQGIGRAICLTAAAHGADVVIHHLGESTNAAADALVQEIEALGQRAVTVSGDIADPETATRVRFGVTPMKRVCPAFFCATDLG